MKRKIFTSLWVLLLGLSLFACGGTADQPTGAENSAPPADRPLVVAVNAQYPPFEFLDSEGRVTGFDEELMTAIAAEAGLTIEIENVLWGPMFNAMNSGQFNNFDLIISAITITEERQEVVNFSDPYFETGLVIVTETGSDISSPDDLFDRLVGLQVDTVAETWVGANTEADVVTYAEVEEAFEALAQGEIEAVVNDLPNSQYLLQQQYGSDLTIVGDPLTSAQYGIVVPKDRPELLAQINEGLAAVRESGTYDRIYDTWFGAIADTPEPVADTAETAAEEPTSEESAAEPAAETTEASAEEPTAESGAESPESPTALPPAELSPVSCEISSLNSGLAGQPHQVEEGEWLSLIAEREYGNPLDYRAIVDFTNQACDSNPVYNCLDNPDTVEVGQVVYLPTPEEVTAYWQQQLSSLPLLDQPLDGEISVTGSSTVFLLTDHMATCFEQGSNFAAGGSYAGEVTVESTGTGEGFDQFCVEAGPDIVDASRPISAAEREACQAVGRPPLEFQIGTDAIAIVINGENGAVSDLTTAELEQALTTAATWSEIRPDWPEEPINRYYPTAESGTLEVLAATLGLNEAALLNAPNLLAQSEDDLALAGAVQNDPWGLSFFGYAYYARTIPDGSLNAVSVDGIVPRPETVDAGTYPLLRPLFIYTTAEIMAEKPQVAAFINFYLQYVKDYITPVGYFLPDEAAFQEAVQTFK